jgi:hypothetical protein
MTKVAKVEQQILPALGKLVEVTSGSQKANIFVIEVRSASLIPCLE